MCRREKYNFYIKLIKFFFADTWLKIFQMPFYLSIVSCNYFRSRLCTNPSTKSNGAYRRRIFPTYWTSLSGRSYPAFYRRDFSHVPMVHPTCSQMEVYGSGFYFNIAYARETPIGGISSRYHLWRRRYCRFFSIWLNMCHSIEFPRRKDIKRTDVTIAWW